MKTQKIPPGWIVNLWRLLWLRKHNKRVWVYQQEDGEYRILQ